MTKVSRGIQPIGWQLHNNLPDDLRVAKRLTMPVSTHESLIGMRRTPTDVPPLVSLHDMLAAFSRSIIAFNPAIFMPDTSDRSWLYAMNETDIRFERLHTLITLWLKACYPEEVVQKVVKQWVNHWSWQTIDLQTVDDALRRLLLPGLIARWLISRQFKLNFGDQIIPLRIAPLMTQRNAAELISEPIANKNGELFSYVLRFWMDTLPPNGEWVLLHRISIRRWLSESLINKDTNIVFFKKGRCKSVFLRRFTGYLDAAPKEDVFARLTLKNTDGKAAGLRWVGHQAKVFNLLHINSMKEQLPEVEDLLKNPLAFRDQLLIPMENSDARYSSIGKGLPIDDHRRIFDQLAVCLAPIALPLPVHPRVAVGDGNRSQKSVSQKKHKEVDARSRFSGLQNLRDQTTIEIYVDQAEHVKEILLDEMGMLDDYKDRLTENPLIIKDGDRILLEIIAKDDLGLTALLPEAANIYRQESKIIQERTDSIARSRPYATQATGALIVLKNYKGNKRDPKKPIRQGLLKSGRMSQFFTPRDEEESLEDYKNHKITNAVRDLLRVMGYRYNPFYEQRHDLAMPDQVDLIGLRLIQLNARHKDEEKLLLPLVVDVPSGDSHLRVIVPGKTGSAQVYPTLREGIIAAANYDRDYTKPEETIAFFRDALRLCNRLNPALLLIHDENLRRTFPELEEQNRSFCHLNTILSDKPNMRVARLRLSSDGEVPNSLPQDQMGKFQGLYAHSSQPQVFYSIHNIGERHTPTKGSSKLQRIGEEDVTPSTVQIWLNNLQDNDDPNAWAALVHRLRLESSHTDIGTVMPQPLHDLDKITEYLTRWTDAKTSEDDLNAIDFSEEGQINE